MQVLELIGAKRAGECEARRGQDLACAGELGRAISVRGRGRRCCGRPIGCAGQIRAGHRARTGRRGHERRDGHLVFINRNLHGLLFIQKLSDEANHYAAVRFF